MPRSRAPLTMAWARGCSLLPSRAAARANRVSAGTSANASTSVRLGLPWVKVPVLSITRVSTLRKVSMASALRNSKPIWAPRPVATMIEIGVARPRAQGQAMISTATALTRARLSRGGGPTRAHTIKVRMATTTTVGTNQAETLSATRCRGARERWASATSCTIWASWVWAPTRSARITTEPVVFKVPVRRVSPTARMTGMDSPVSMASSKLLLPSSTSPSTGTLAPGRMRRRSPIFTASRATSCSCPSASMRRAVLGARSSRARRTAPVQWRARSSSHSPSSTRATIMAAASKYRPT